MGACTFVTHVQGDSAYKAFQAAVEDAREERGSRGHTGTIAEKSKYQKVDLPFVYDGSRDHKDLVMGFVRSKLREKPFDDKYGPAGCIELGREGYLFFGWASE